MCRPLALIFAFVIGFSMASLGQTQVVSQFGTTTAAAPSVGVKYVSKGEVLASFVKGGTLASEGNYRVMTAHLTRTTDANVEVHRSYVDVLYIVQGSTTIITGGK